MAHAFDTGLEKPIRTVLVESAIALLAPLTVAEGGYLKAVVEYGGVVRSSMDEDGVKLLSDCLSGRAPAIAIGIGDGVGQPKGDRLNMAEELELLVYHFNNNARGLARGRTNVDVAGAASNQADPGLHVAIEHAMELLAGQYTAIAPMCNHIRYDRTVELVTRRDLTIWLQTFQIRVSRTLKRFRTAPELLKSIHWRFIREHDEANQPLPPTKPSTLESHVDNLDP